MKTTFVKIIKNLLLAFILISIGFSLGKYKYKSQAKESSASEIINQENQYFIHVYYMHSTFRCTTCNTIEKMTKELLEKNYKSELDEKQIIFSEVDFQSNENLAKEFQITSSCVVVALEKNGTTTDFRRLDDVWILLEKPDEFNKYISNTINSYLNEITKKGDFY